MIRRFLASTAICLALFLEFVPAPVWADWDEGVAAYNRGDYATA